MAAAKPRDFQYERGRFQPVAKPGTGGGGGSTTSTGAQWPDGKGLVYRATGRVYFTLTTGDYICSGAVATETDTGRSIVLTAAHCAYDNEVGAFASYWMFIPEFDTTPTYDCALTVHGCWTAHSLVVHSGFANEPGFTTNATLHDWAFAVVTDGTKGGQLDAKVGSFPIAFRDYGSGTKMHATGYPAGGKYAPGHELIYCSGGVGFDMWNANRTYKLKCDMTGGSSGGPWLTEFASSGDTGVLSSVNSYTYSGMTAMHGPKFNAKTQATWASALTTTGNAIVQ